MRAALVVLIVVATAATARADDEIGVVVVGDVAMQPSVASYLEHWLKTHGHKTKTSPLSTDATNTIVNCLVIDDSKCARNVVEARSKAATVVFARVDVAKGEHNVTFNLYWFVKGHEGIGERRVCEKCTEDSWHGIADAMMSALAGSSQSEQGRVKIASRPSGMIVLLDNVQIGVTPLERDVPVGHHRIELTHAGRSVGRRQVDVTAGETENVDIKVDVDTGSSRLGPAILLGAGIVGLGTGSVFLYYGSIGGPNAKYTFNDSTPVGIGILAVGLGATIGGTILLAQSGHSGSTPIASIGPGGGYVGWLTRF
jgi:hypothetical protein